MNFLPWRLKPNRSEPSAPVTPTSDGTDGLCRLIETMLVELLAGRPQPPSGADELAELMRPASLRGPLSLYRLDDLRAARLPPVELTRAVMENPELCHGFGSPAHDFGRDVRLSRQVTTALADVGLRFRLGQLMLLHLAERVIFHPGPPPCPVFTARGLLALLPAALLHDPALTPIIEEHPCPTFWDHWLLRQMRDTPGWPLTVATEDLALFNWSEGDPAPAILPPDAPAYWRSILETSF